MKRIVQLLLTCILLTSGISCNRQQSSNNNGAGKKAYLVSVSHLPPHYYIENGEWTGMDVELVKAVIKETGLEVDFRELPRNKAVNSLQEGTIDIILSLSKRGQTKESCHFIGPQRMERITLAVNKKYRDLPIYSIDDLKNTANYLNRKIILQKNIVYTPSLDKPINENPGFAASFAFVSEPDQQFEIVNSDRGIGFFEEYFTLAYRIKGSLEFNNLSVHPFVLSTQPVYFGVSKKISLEKLKLFQKAYNKLERNGTLEKLRTKWSKMYRITSAIDF